MTLYPIHCSFTDKDGKRIVWYEREYEEVKQDHPEVETDFDKIQKAVEGSYHITQDVDYSNRRCYYLLFSGRGDYKNKHMKVVVKYRIYVNKIITAYFTDRVKQDEKILWTKLRNN